MFQEKVATELVRLYYDKLNSAPQTLPDLYAEDAVVCHGLEGVKSQFHRGIVNIRKHFQLDILNLSGSVVALTSLRALPKQQNEILIVLIGEIKPVNSEIQTFTQTLIIEKKEQGPAVILSDVLNLLKLEVDVASDSPQKAVPLGPKQTQVKKSEKKEVPKAPESEVQKPKKKFTFENVAKASTFTPKTNLVSASPAFHPFNQSMAIPPMPPMQYVPMYPQMMPPIYRGEGERNE